MIGAGGAGKAVAFGLVALGQTESRIADRDLPTAQALAAALVAARPGLVAHAGTPLPRASLTGPNGCLTRSTRPLTPSFCKTPPPRVCK